MYLCQELAQLVETNVVPDQVLSLLHFVKSDVCEDEIVTLLKEATKHKNNEEKEEVERRVEGKLYITLTFYSKQ